MLGRCCSFMKIHQKQLESENGWNYQRSYNWVPYYLHFYLHTYSSAISSRSKIEQFKQLHISTYCSQYTISITEILARLVRSSISVWYIRELVHYISGVWFVLQPYICIHIFITTPYAPPPPTHTHLHTFTASRAFLLSSWILVEIICSKTTCA